MNDIYTAIDLGSDSVKIVVCQKVSQKYYVLASCSKPSSGIVNGFIRDVKMATLCVKSAVEEIRDMLGVDITKVIACIPPQDCEMNIVSGSSAVSNYESISGNDVSRVLLDAIKSVDLGENEIVTAMPINFTIDAEVSVRDPKGMKGSNLSSRVVISTTPKNRLYQILEVLEKAGLEAIDIGYSTYGDYYAFREEKFDDMVGAVVNIGEESTNISIFNRGIQIKNGVIPIGSKNVDKDLSYVYKCSLEDARNIKENFAISLASYADTNDSIKVRSEKEESQEVSQLGASKVVESRIREILNVSKNEIKNLTNREIRYIIITGGLTELSGFHYLVEQEFGYVAKVCNMMNMGVRHNKFSSCFGTIKYFNDKLDLRGKKYKMFTDEDYAGICDVNSEKIVDKINNKVFDHFFDN